MTTKTAGGKITGILALTCETAVALAVGDPVHVSGVYTVAKSDGSKPVIGRVSVANVRRSAATGFYPTAKTPGDVTVEAFGVGVFTFKSGTALATAGVNVGINSAAKVAIDGAGVAHIGVLLTTATAADEDVDVLVGAV